MRNAILTCPGPARAHRLPLRALALAGASALALAAGAAEAQSPQGGVVAGGSARIAQEAGRTTVAQTSRRAVIDWQGFDVGRDHRVVFDQPGRAAATLNRVNSARASVIAGRVQAPGTIVIQNTAGVLFTPTARVDVGGLVATSQTVDPARFERDGALAIRGGERAGAAVRNQGSITIGEAGLAALVGGNVANDGAIVARKGTVALASGTRTTIDLTGDGMVRIAVGGDGGGVANSGLIDAPDGRVVLSAGGAARALDGVINMTGVIRAGSGTARGGTVELTGRGQGRVAISGSIDASGRSTGGSVAITGAHVALDTGARITARGGADGGAVRIGGDFQGLGPLRRAQSATVADGAHLAADGGAGAGGMVVVWSDGATSFDGRITATGGSTGGVAETSGAFALAVGPHASVGLGRGGRWLLDPRDVVIETGGVPVPPGTTTPPPGSGDYVVDRDVLADTLDDGGDVTISARQPDGDGDITVRRALAWIGAGALRLEAGRVLVDKAVTTRDGDLALAATGEVRIGAPVTSTGSADITVDAGDVVAVDHSVQAIGTGGVAVVSRAGDVRMSGNNTPNLWLSTTSGALSVEATRGSVKVHRDGKQAGSIQLHSGSGALAIRAGDRILVQGGSSSASWVRVGQSGGSGPVTLTADRIKVRGGTSPQAFAEVVAGAGGSLALYARSVGVANATAEARVVALEGADLTMRAETQAWDGPIRAGTGGQDGGNVLLSGAITASVQPHFGLAPGRNFTLQPRTPAGAPGSYVSVAPVGVTTSGAGAIEIGAPVTAFAITLVSRERVGVAAGAVLTATGPGNALVVAAGRRFRNDAGAGVLRTTSAAARWLLYVDDFAAISGAEPGPRGFDLYGRSYASTPPGLIPAGNRIVYEQRPILTVTADSLGKTYGGEAAPGYAVSGLRAGDSLGTALATGPAVTSTGAPAWAAVGTHVSDVAATPSDQGYALRLVDGTLTVAPAPLTVTADDKTRTYGSANPRLSATFTGFVLGQDADDLHGRLRLATDASAQSPTGRYAIRAAGLESGNYAITYADGTLTVDRAPLTVAVDDKAKTYGAANPTLTASYTGFVLGEDAGVLTGVLATDATDRSPTGRYAITAAGLDSANYAITYADGTLTVNRAPLTVAVDDKARTYGSANPTLTARYSGFVLGEDAGVLTGALATDATDRSSTGRYAVTAAGLDSVNYAITATDGTLTVDRAPLTVAVDDKAKTYGAANPTLTASYSGFVLGEDTSVLTGALATDATQASNAGTYAITAAGLDNPNYAISFTDGTLSVGRAPLTVSADDKSRTYGGSNPTLTASITGFALGEDIDALDGTLTLATPATEASSAGTYAISAAGLDSANYAISFADGTLTVDRAPLTVVVDDKAKTYGAANPTLTASHTGFVLGENAGVLTGALTTNATQASNAGTYAITAAGLDSQNYAIGFTDGTLTVDRARLTVSVDDKARTYGAANPTLTARYTGFVLGEDASDFTGALATDATQASNAGTYAITAAGLDNPNYAISFTDGALTVDRAPLTVRANDAARRAGAANPAFSASYRGFVLGEAAGDLDGAPAFATPASAASAPGRYAVTPNGLRSANYAIAFLDGTLTVTPAATPPAPPPPGPTPTPPTPGAPPTASVADLAEPYRTGVPPLTPGDASFRTTITEAPPSLENPFALTYSLGEIVQLAPVAAPGNGGFVPAAGGVAPDAAPASDCGGPVNRGNPPAGCERRSVAESYWTTIAGETP